MHESYVKYHHIILLVHCNSSLIDMEFIQSLVCNLCGVNVDGIAFRTKCCHFYCPPCAKTTFQRSQSCAICRYILTDSDVNEISIGIPATEEAVINNLYQALLQSTSFPDISQRLTKIIVNIGDITKFITLQLQSSVEFSTERRVRTEKTCETQALELEKFHRKIVELECTTENLQRNYEHQLRESNRALAELQEAYKEKIRKCQAWEKAYNSVRGRAPPPDDHSTPCGEMMAVPSSSNFMAPKHAYSQHRVPMQRTEVTTFRNVTNHHHSRAYPAGETSSNSAFPTTASMSPSPTTHSLPFNTYPTLQGTSQRREFQESNRLPQNMRGPPSDAQQDGLIRHPLAAHISRQPEKDSWDMRGYNFPGGAYTAQQQAATVKRSFFD